MRLSLGGRGCKGTCVPPSGIYNIFTPSYFLYENNYQRGWNLKLSEKSSRQVEVPWGADKHVQVCAGWGRGGCGRCGGSLRSLHGQSKACAWEAVPMRLSEIQAFKRFKPCHCHLIGSTQMRVVLWESYSWRVGKQLIKMSAQPLNMEPELPSQRSCRARLRPQTSGRLKRWKINLWTGPKAIATLFSKELFVKMTRKQLLWLLDYKLKGLFLIEN